MGAGRVGAGAAIGSAIAPGLGTIIGAGIGGLTNLIGQGMSRRAAREYNKGQMEIAQMNNEWNANEALKNREWQEQMVALQNQWNLDQWSRENEYNSPIAQRERLEAAGLNPYMMLDGGNAGSASSVSSASPSGGSQAAPAQMPQQQALKYDFSSVADAINSYYTNRQILSQIKSQDVNTEIAGLFGKDLAKAKLFSMTDGQLYGISDEYRRIMENAAPEMAITGLNKFRAEAQAARAYAEQAFAQAAYTNLKGEALEITTKYLDLKEQFSLVQTAAAIYEMYSSGRLNYAQMEKVMDERISLQLGNTLKRLDIKQRKAVIDGLIMAMNAESAYQRDYFDALGQWAGSLARSEKDKAIYDAKLKRFEAERADSFRGYYNSPGSGGIYRAIDFARSLIFGF